MGRDMIEERRKNPTDDLMSVVANTKIEGGELPPELLDGFFLLMVIAGNETTRNTITGGLMALTDNPEERDKLIKDPSLIANATDEMLRWVTSVIYFRRTATKDTQIRGQDIKKGQVVRKPKQKGKGKGQPDKAGNNPGEEYYDVEVSLDELAKYSKIKVLKSQQTTLF